MDVNVGVITLEGFVRMPEDKTHNQADWEDQKLCCTELDFSPDTDGMPALVDKLRHLHEEYKKGDNRALVTGLQVAMHCGVYPPLWVLEGLNDRFTRFDDLNTRGEDRTLDDVFDFGGKVAYRDRCFQPIYEQMFVRYYHLKRFWELNDDDCFEAIAQSFNWEAIAGADTVKHKRPALTARTIRDLHAKNGWNRQYIETCRNQKNTQTKTVEEADNFLNLFPEEARLTIKAQARRNPTVPRLRRK